VVACQLAFPDPEEWQLLPPQKKRPGKVERSAVREER
jgi:hypothetical protein